MKYFLFIVFFLTFSMPVFSSNILQQEYDIKNTDAEMAVPLNYDKEYLIKEDYYGYKNGKKSLYGGLVYTIKEVQKSNNQYKAVNLRYLNLAKIKYEKIALLQNNDLDKNIRLNAISSKIIIEDEDYKKLTPDVKEIIRILNSIFVMN